jgi:hypothetical protein
VLFIWWNDNTCVSIGTNCDNVDILAAVTTWNRGIKQKVDTLETRVLKIYNSHVGGVDHTTGWLESVELGVRGKTWYWAIFARMIDITIINAWVLYRHTRGSDALQPVSFKSAVSVYTLPETWHRQEPARMTLFVTMYQRKSDP